MLKEKIERKKIVFLNMHNSISLKFDYFLFLSRYYLTNFPLGGF